MVHSELREKLISPLYSIITVVYNRSAELEATIQNILSQNFKEIEYLVIDGGSTDGTLNIIQKYSSKISKWISEPDKGIYDAMNKGIRLATGQWIIFMNAGDFFYNTHVLEKCAGYLESIDDKIFVYGDAEVLSPTSKHIQNQKDRHLDLTKSIIHQATFIRSSYLKKNPYNIRYRIMADYDSLLRVSSSSPEQCMYIPEVICVYDKTGVSSRPLYTYFKEFYSIARGHMSTTEFISFNFYILPRLIWSFRLAWK
jgi:glycosyltransferase involved in cell wall biosynthesis